MNNQIYFESFACLDDVIHNFCISHKELEGCEILYAAYDTPQYEGYAHVIYLKNGQLYEVNASHCSCYGLEGCWEPEETSAVALLSRPNVSDAAKANIKERYKNLMWFL